MKALRWVGVAALMYTVSAFGGQWVGTTQVESAGKVSLDKDRFERRGNAVTAYIQILFDKPVRMPFMEKLYDRSEQLYFFQCKDKQMVLNSYILKNGDEVVHTQSSMTLDGKPLQQAVPEKGLEAAAFKLACGYKPKP